MNEIRYRFTQCISTLTAHDPQGRITTYRNRHASCFIITLQGEIRFTFDRQVIVTNSKRGIFIPKGTDYLNECLQTAQSIVVNFEHTETDTVPAPLEPVFPDAAITFYENVNRRLPIKDSREEYYILAELYLLAYRLFKNPLQSPKERLAEKAYRFLKSNAANATLQISDAAMHCSISDVYLRKIFHSIYGKSPFEILTEIRMEKARMMLDEKLSVGETAFAVGYSDIYSFSRAYKRHFGFAPTKER